MGLEVNDVEGDLDKDMEDLEKQRKLDEVDAVIAYNESSVVKTRRISFGIAAYWMLTFGVGFVTVASSNSILYLIFFATLLGVAATVPLMRSTNREYERAKAAIKTCHTRKNILLGVEEPKESEDLHDTIHVTGIVGKRYVVTATTPVDPAPPQVTQEQGTAESYMAKVNALYDEYLSLKSNISFVIENNALFNSSFEETDAYELMNMRLAEETFPTVTAAREFYYEYARAYKKAKDSAMALGFKALEADSRDSARRLISSLAVANDRSASEGERASAVEKVKVLRSDLVKNGNLRLPDEASLELARVMRRAIER